MCKVQPYTYVEVFLVCDAVAVMDVEAVHRIRSGRWMLRLRLDFASFRLLPRLFLHSSECCMKWVSVIGVVVPGTAVGMRSWWGRLYASSHPGSKISLFSTELSRTKFSNIFYVLLTVQYVMILGECPTWLTILSYVFIFIFNLTCFEHIVLIIRRDIVSTQPLVDVILSMAVSCADDTATDTEW